SAHEPERWLDAHDPAARRWRDDRPVGLRPDCYGAKICGDRYPRARARARGRPIQRIRITALTASAAPTARRVRGPEVRPLGQVRLAEDHRSRGPEPLDDEGVARGGHAHEGERAGRTLHP